MKNNQNEWNKLHAQDKFRPKYPEDDIVRWLFSNKGVIGFSSAIIEGDKLRILTGPLMGQEDKIIKVNRRFQNCLVALDFEGKQFKVWLGYELKGEL